MSDKRYSFATDAMYRKKHTFDMQTVTSRSVCACASTLFNKDLLCYLLFSTGRELFLYADNICSDQDFITHIWFKGTFYALYINYTPKYQKTTLRTCAPSED